MEPEKPISLKYCEGGCKTALDYCDQHGTEAEEAVCTDRYRACLKECRNHRSSSPH